MNPNGGGVVALTRLTLETGTSAAVASLVLMDADWLVKLARLRLNRILRPRSRLYEHR